MAEYKEIFIFVSGSTPQIITETIYALAKKEPPIHPSEIIVITTMEGAKIARETLQERGILNALFKEYKIPNVELKFEIPKDNQGVPLSDIRTTEDNKAIADLITHVIKEKTSMDDARLHCSIAGGRKTMSFYLGSALQLYGRSQDRLYHVLVTPEFESNRNFYYKPLKNQEIIASDGKKLNTDDAVITLAELPFIRLGDKTKITGKDFDESVKAGQDAINEAVFLQEVSVDFDNRVVKIGDVTIKMQPIQLAIYAAMLKAKRDCRKKRCDESCTKCYFHRKSWTEDQKKILIEFYNIIRPMSDIKFLKENFQERLASLVAKINKEIKKSLANDILAQNYIIKTKRRYYETKYYIEIDRKKIGKIGLDSSDRGR